MECAKCRFLAVLACKICLCQEKAVNLGSNIVNWDNCMAKPIKETPVLTGRDAERFAYAVEHPREVTKEEVLRAKAVFERLYPCSELR